MPTRLGHTDAFSEVIWSCRVSRNSCSRGGIALGMSMPGIEADESELRERLTAIVHSTPVLMRVLSGCATSVFLTGLCFRARSIANLRQVGGRQRRRDGERRTDLRGDGGAIESHDPPTLPEFQPGRAAGIYTSTYAAGSAGSFLIAGLVDEAFGWRATFVAAGIGPLLSICALTLLPAPYQDRETCHRRPPYRALLRNRALIAYVAAFAGNTWEVFAVRVWFVAYLAWLLSLPGNHMTLQRSG